MSSVGEVQIQVCSTEYCPEAIAANGAEFAASHCIIYLCAHYFYGLRTFKHKNDARIYVPFDVPRPSRTLAYISNFEVAPGHHELSLSAI